MCYDYTWHCPDDNFFYRWNPPSAIVYQPLTASAFDAPVGYLKGYRVYQYDSGNDIDGNRDGQLKREMGMGFEYGLAAGRE